MNVSMECSMKPYFLVFLGSIILGCSDNVPEFSSQASEICMVAEKSFENDELDNLLSYLKNNYDIESGKIRFDESGVYIPLKERFVEESGYYIAAPGHHVNGEGSDPAFREIEKCLYRYHIKG